MDLNIAPVSKELNKFDLPISPAIDLFTEVADDNKKLVKKNEDRMLMLKKDVYNGFSSKTNTTKVICKYKI